MTLTANQTSCYSLLMPLGNVRSHLTALKWATDKVRLLEAAIPHHPIAADPDQGSRPGSSLQATLNKLGRHVIWRFPGVNKDGCFPQLMATSPVTSPQLTPSLLQRWSFTHVEGPLPRCLAIFPPSLNRLHGRDLWRHPGQTRMLRRDLAPLVPALHPRAARTRRIPHHQVQEVPFPQDRAHPRDHPAQQPSMASRGRAALLWG